MVKANGKKYRPEKTSILWYISTLNEFNLRINPTHAEIEAW